MLSANITLRPQSFLLCASGEGRANIDSEIVFDKHGLPYFPGRRLKGLLRESMIEVLEIRGKTEAKIQNSIQHFFGNEGSATNKGLLTINNLWIEDYQACLQYLQQHQDLDYCQPVNVRDFFTHTIQQTALENRIAKDKSLRTYQVLKHQQTVEAFTGPLHLKAALNSEETILLKDTLAHFRYAGLRRNRGFGKLKCELGSFTEVPEADSTFNQQEVQAIAVSIKCEQNIILSLQKGEQNTVFSEDVITGNRIRGALAGIYLRKYKAADEDFKKLFLRHQLSFQFCYPKGVQVLPACIHRLKYFADFQGKNILAEAPNIQPEKEQEKLGITKKITGFMGSEGLYLPPKAYQFHNSRPVRVAGRSVDRNQEKELKVSGGIFYYESIKAGTIFQGRISGRPEVLRLLLEKIGEEQIAYIGKSKSAQYGRVKLRLAIEQVQEVAKEKRNDPPPAFVYLLALSPILLFNENGFAVPTEEHLEAAIHQEVEGIRDFKIHSAAAQLTTLEQFNTQWLSKTGRHKAFKEGSIFKVAYQSELEQLVAIGEWQDQGLGRVKVLKEEEIDEYIRKIAKQAQRESSDHGEKNRQEQQAIPALLEEIRKKRRENEEHSKKKSEAMEDSEQLFNHYHEQNQTISNSLIGRMQAILALQDIRKIKEQLEHIREKQSGKLLEKYLLYDQLNSISPDIPKEESEQYFIYWTTFFKSLRLRNKKENN